MFVKGFEPNLSALVGLRGAMERAQSVPLDDRMVGSWQPVLAPKSSR